MSSEHQVLLVPEDFSTIQAAVNALAGPATIVVAPGVYAESVRVGEGRNVVIQSAGLSRRGVVLTGDDADDAVLSVAGAIVFLSGIEVRSDARMRGVVATDATISLQECVVAGNRAAGRGAGLSCRRSVVRIQKSAVIGNVVDGGDGGGGLYLDDCRVEIAGSTIQANAVHARGQARGGGVWCGASSMRMWRSRVTDNALFAPRCSGGGIFFANPRQCRLGGSVITGNSCQEGSGGGIFIDGDTANVVVHSTTVVRQNHPNDLE